LDGDAKSLMDESDVLLAMAEIAVALLGFAAIVSVFSQRGTWRPDGRFWAMVGSGIGTLVFSMLPLPFLFAGVEPASAWRSCNALLGLFALGYCVLMIHSYRRDLAADSAPNVPIFAVLLGGSACVCPFLLASAIGYFGDAQFWPYLIGIVWFQVLTATLFVRLLVVWLR
jgi:hypothetical protein